MFHAAAYGYGRVYRTYPQAQLEQIPAPRRPLMPVDAAPIRLVPPWELEAEHWAAVAAMRAVVYLVDMEVQPGGKFAPIPYPFPRLEQWWPHRYDPPDTRAIFAQFALPRVPPPPPPPLIPPWVAELAHLAALTAASQAVYLERSDRLPIPPPISFTPLGQWIPRPLPFDLAYYGIRQRLLPVVPESPPLAAWIAQLENWAALNATTPAVYLERTDQVAPVAPPLPVPAWLGALANWAALSHAEQTLYQARPQQQAVPFPPLVIMPWEVERAMAAAFMASTPVLYAVARSLGQVIPESPVVPPWVAQAANWAALGFQAPAVYVARLEAGRPHVVEVTPAWLSEQQNWAALSHAEQAVYLARPWLIQGVEAAPVVHPWALEQALTAALTAPQLTLYLARYGVERFIPPEVVKPPPPQWDWGSMLPPGAWAIWDQLRARLPLPFIIIIPRPPGLVGVTVTNLRANARPIPPWVAGLIEETDPKILAPGTISEGENLVPEKAPRLATRGGSRVMLTLHDDAGGAELSHVCELMPKSTTGAIAVGWSSGTTKHYAYAVTSDMALAGASEALSRTPFPATWNRASVARPVLAELFEKLYCCDATVLYSTRNTLVSIDRAIAPTIAEPTFAFAGGAAQALRPYCLEEYNNVLFIAGYGDEGGGGADDDPALVRHSFLGQDPGGANGFNKDAYNTIGAKGDRVTAMKKGRGLLLIAKANELYRLEGAGRGYPGWQYQVQGVSNTQGLGVENAFALEHAEDLWFGIGKQGPFMSDGFSAESLVGPRQKTWRGLDQLGVAFVRYHPERRLILFGVHQVSGAPDSTYPWIGLAWDLTRRVWQPNWRVAGSTTKFFSMRAIATTTAAGPGAPPNTPVTSAVTGEGWTASWTNGDGTAETEYWEQEVFGTWVLKQAYAAGITTTGVLAGRKSHLAHNWKVRHRKSGVPSQYVADQLVKTLLAPPVITIVPIEHTTYKIVNVTNGPNENLVTLVLERSPTGAGTWTVVNTWTNVVKGELKSRVVTDPTLFDYRAKATDAAWPTTDSVYSATVNG